jgi:hypothetical protein
MMSVLVTVGAFQYSYNIGTFFFAIVYVAALEEEDADVVSLFTPVTALELEAAALLVMREAWSVSPVMMA